jgi:glycosyltransferase involved in cell wall biosynthesis
MKNLIWNLVLALFIPVFFFAAILPSRAKKYFIWGSAPLINNKYWSNALREHGFDSITLMQYHFKMNKRDDFDFYVDDFAPKLLPRVVRMGLGTCLALIFALRRAKVVHISFNGFLLGHTPFWRLESFLFRVAGVKVIVVPFGADVFMYSKLIDPSLRYGLLVNYPKYSRSEDRVEKYVKYWVKRADIVIAGPMIDGVGRWDVTINNMFAIDTKSWKCKVEYSENNGINGSVKVLHTPNHGGFKGTEFVIDAVAQLKQEGLLVDLILLEQVSNEKVRELVQTVDILAEQFIATGYALSGLEGMASGLPVLANLDHEAYTRVFRRYAFLNECPILSTSPESLVENMRLLVKNPALRKELGSASRKYVEKYHSSETVQYLFGSIYDKILYGKSVELINLFHPLKSEYNKRKPYIQHPLVENKLPSDYPLQ